jgi:hypothetical protein
VRAQRQEYAMLWGTKTNEIGIEVSPLGLRRGVPACRSECWQEPHRSSGDGKRLTFGPKSQHDHRGRVMEMKARLEGHEESDTDLN